VRSRSAFYRGAVSSSAIPSGSLNGSTAAPARAIGAFGPPVTISDPPCEFDAWNVDLARDAGEVAHGFADLWGTGCNEGFAIRYFEGSGTTWTAQATPYRGFVAAVAWDTTGTYLLYIDFATFNLRITKRLTNGTYTGGRLLSTHVDVDGSLPQGDVVAVGGRWWAVWREHVAPGGSPGGEDDQTDLFQASTIGGTLHARQRITTNPRWDSMPTLAAMPGSTFPLTLIWSRGGSDLDPGQTDLRRALGSAGGTWSSNSFATRGTLNFWPDAQVAGTTTYVAGCGTTARWRPTTAAGRLPATPSTRRRSSTALPRSRSHPAAWWSAGRCPRPHSGRLWPSGSAQPGRAPTPPPPRRPESSSSRGWPPVAGRRPR
jgi:hypothetical protein